MRKYVCRYLGSTSIFRDYFFLYYEARKVKACFVGVAKETDMYLLGGGVEIYDPVQMVV